MIDKILNTVVTGPALETLQTFPAESINSVITSPPYWQLRDYGFKEQWGLEPSFHLYLEHLWQLMDEIWRVLKPDGTVWINLGDTYNTGKSGFGERAKGTYQETNTGSFLGETQSYKMEAPKKSLLLIPHRFAIGCIDRGWIMRNDIIWAKVNNMPESITDRFSKKHEYFFFMTKNQRYYFDLDSVRGSHKEESLKRAARAWGWDDKKQPWGCNPNQKNVGYNDLEDKVANGELRMLNQNGKNPGDVADFWDIPQRGNKKDHYAAYNTELIDKPIIAGSPEGAIILDPFAGTGTTLVRARELNRNVIGIEGSKKYSIMANQELTNFESQLRMFG